MDAVSDSKIEKFEYETQEPTPYDILQMADAYKRPDLCNYYCSHKCKIGYRYVPEVEVVKSKFFYFFSYEFSCVFFLMPLVRNS